MITVTQIIMAVSGLVVSLVYYIGRERKKRSRCIKLRRLRHDYRDAVSEKNKEQAAALGLAYYTLIGKGKISSNNRDKISVAISEMK